MSATEIRAAAEAISSARHLLISTGAGMSKESGIPTFRDALDGLWSRFDPQELATEAAFRHTCRSNLASSPDEAPSVQWAWLCATPAFLSLTDRSRTSGCSEHQP